MSFWDQNPAPTSSAPIAGSAPNTASGVGYAVNAAPTAQSAPMTPYGPGYGFSSQVGQPANGMTGGYGSTLASLGQIQPSGSLGPVNGGTPSGTLGPMNGSGTSAGYGFSSQVGQPYGQAQMTGLNPGSYLDPNNPGATTSTGQQMSTSNAVGQSANSAPTAGTAAGPGAFAGYGNLASLSGQSATTPNYGTGYGSAQPGQMAQPSAGYAQMRAPNGETDWVHPDHIDHYTSMGATRL